MFALAAVTWSHGKKNMTVNGPLAMYRIRPIYDFFPSLDLPTCMYKMSNLMGEIGSPNNTRPDDQTLSELEKRQNVILRNLEELKSQVLKLREELITPIPEQLKQYQDIVIKANPKHPPLSIWVLYHLLSKSLNVRLVTYVHSSLKTVPEVVYLKALQGVASPEPWNLSLTVIWRDTDKDNEMMIDPIQQGVIQGEVNIIRYLARLLNLHDVDPVISTLTDNWLELAHGSIIHGSNKEKQAAVKVLNSYLGTNKFLVGSTESLADVAIWSALVQAKLHLNLPPNVQTWHLTLLDTNYFTNCKEIILI